MPIFEYVCRECDREFEVLVQGSTTVECPSCGGKDLEKQLSTFAAGNGRQNVAANSLPIGACGTCRDPRGPGSCSMS
jgi:putative FmdB family regulatory protein